MSFDRFHWPRLHAFQCGPALELAPCHRTWQGHIFQHLGSPSIWNCDMALAPLAWLWAVTHSAPALLPVVTARAEPSHAPLGELQAD